MTTHKKLYAFLVALSFTGVSLARPPVVKPERIRGDIVSFHDTTLTVHRRSGGTVLIDVQPDIGVSALKAINLSDVKAGTYVGAPAITGPDGKLTASALLVFPEAARGQQEGHFPYDFGPHSTMTNANVDAVTVVTGTHGRNLTLSYKGGSNVITVPASVQVVTFAPATRADLTAGKKVVVVATPAQHGVLEAQVVLVEKDGVVPPL